MLHIHIFKTPIASIYMSFEWRRIIYQCRCGKKISKEIYDNYYNGIGFPIETTHFSQDEDEFELIYNDRKFLTI